MKKTFSNTVAVIIFFLFITSVFIAFPLKVKASQGSVSFRLGVLEDPSGTIQISNLIVENPVYKFSSAADEIPNFGYTTSTIWFKLDISEKPGNEDLLLVINYPPLDSIDLYFPDGSGKYLVKTTGDSYLFSHRDILHRNYIFQIHHKNTQPLFLKIKSESQIQLPATIWHAGEFYSHDRIENLVMGIYFGILIIMALYNFFIYISTKESSYAFYVLYVISMLFFQLSQSGFAYEFLWPEHQWWANRSHPFWTSTTVFWGTIFCIAFLNIKKASRMLFITASVLSSLLFVLIIASLTVSYSLSVRTNTILLPLNVIFVVCLGFYMMFRGYRPARFFIIAWVFYAAFIIIHALNRAGLMQRSFISEYGTYIGSVIEITLLALALADRINIIKNENEKADRAVLIKQKEHEAMNRELLLARQIQESLLPGKIPLPADIRIAYKYVPMSTIGGDFINIHYRKTRNDLGLFIGDVSGHGVPAALTASMVKIAMNTWSDKLEDPVSILNTIHASIKDKLGGNFITAQACHLDINTGALLIAGAGHPSTIIIRKDGTIEECLIRGRFLSDAFETKIATCEKTINRGDKILLYSDCIIEAQSNGELLGDARFFEFLGRNYSLETDAMCQAVYDYVRKYTNLENLEDDFTILITEYRDL